VVYEDGDYEWLTLAQERFQWLPERARCASASAAFPHFSLLHPDDNSLSCMHAR
jgi:hypothetical protein